MIKQPSHTISICVHGYLPPHTVSYRAWEQHKNEIAQNSPWCSM